DKSRLLELLELRGGIEVCRRAEEIVDSEQGKSVVDELKALWDILEDY
ncbi:ATP phosphoribosyltransferase regulatory subunit, partial [Bacillus inaquosorum]|nr:ATP phosphoribosyltransferase regulatory subunit [Bacillus inaquosorum]